MKHAIITENQSNDRVNESQEAHFLRVKTGSKSSLAKFIDNERPRMFDYVIRMTGDMSHGTEVVQNVLSRLKIGETGSFTNYLDLLAMLYQKVRAESQDVWDADTSRLENAHYKLLAINETPAHLKGQNLNQSKIEDFDKVFRGIPPKERETLWLKSHIGFSLAQMAQIMSVTELDVQRHLVSGLFNLEAAAHQFGETDAELVVANMPMHPLPAPISGVTVDLSMVMQGIKSGQKKPEKSYKWLIIGLALIGVCGASLIFFGTINYGGGGVSATIDAGLHVWHRLWGSHIPGAKPAHHSLPPPVQ